MVGEINACRLSTYVYWMQVSYVNARNVKLIFAAVFALFGTLSHITHVTSHFVYFYSPLFRQHGKWRFDGKNFGSQATLCRSKLRRVFQLDPGKFQSSSNPWKWRRNGEKWQKMLALSGSLSNMSQSVWNNKNTENWVSFVLSLIFLYQTLADSVFERFSSDKLFSGVSNEFFQTLHVSNVQFFVF